MLDRYDGVSLHPYEVLFVKVKGFMLDAQWSSALTAVKYDAWTNPWVRGPDHRLPHFVDPFCHANPPCHADLPCHAPQIPEAPSTTQAPQQPNNNDYTRHVDLHTAPRTWLMQHRNRSCFDAVFYQQRSADLAGLRLPDLWPHFVQHGQFEGRPWRSGGQTKGRPVLR